MPESTPEFNKKPENIEELKDILSNMYDVVVSLRNGFENNSVEELLASFENAIEISQRFKNSNAEVRINDILSKKAHKQSDLTDGDLKFFQYLINRIQFISGLCQSISEQNAQFREKLNDLRISYAANPKRNALEDYGTINTETKKVRDIVLNDLPAALEAAKDILMLDDSVGIRTTAIDDNNMKGVIYTKTFTEK